MKNRMPKPAVNRKTRIGVRAATKRATFDGVEPFVPLSVKPYFPTQAGLLFLIASFRHLARNEG